MPKQRDDGDKKHGDALESAVETAANRKKDDADVDEEDETDDEEDLDEDDEDLDDSE